MFSVCRTSAAAVLARRALLTKSQLRLLLRLLLWEFGDPGSTLGKAQPPWSLREQSVRAGATDGEPGRVRPSGQSLGDVLGAVHALLCPSSAPWEWQDLVGHSRKGERGRVSVAGMGWDGQDEDPPLLGENAGAGRWQNIRMEQGGAAAPPLPSGLPCDGMKAPKLPVNPGPGIGNLLGSLPSHGARCSRGL